jgi:hypothetical protein
MPTSTTMPGISQEPSSRVSQAQPRKKPAIAAYKKRHRMVILPKSAHTKAAMQEIPVLCTGCIDYRGRANRLAIVNCLHLY